MAKTVAGLREEVTHILESYEKVNPENKGAKVLFFRMKGHGQAGVARKKAIADNLRLEIEDLEYVQTLAIACYDTYRGTGSDLINDLRFVLSNYCKEDTSRSGIIIVAKVIVERYQREVNPSEQRGFGRLWHLARRHGARGRRRAEEMLERINNPDPKLAEAALATYCYGDSARYDSKLLEELIRFCGSVSDKEFRGPSNVLLAEIDI